MGRPEEAGVQVKKGPRVASGHQGTFRKKALKEEGEFQPKRTALWLPRATFHEGISASVCPPGA